MVGAVAQGQTSVQRTNSYNEVLSSARDEFCPLVTKDIIIKDDAPWYDHRMVSLRRQRRRPRESGGDLGLIPRGPYMLQLSEQLLNRYLFARLSTTNISWPLLLVIIGAHSSF